MFWWGGCTKIDPNLASSDNLLKYLWSPFITLHAAPGQLFLQIRCHLSEKVKIIKNVGVVHFKLSAARRCRTDPILICYSQRQLTNLQYHRQIVKRFTFTVLQFTEWYFLFLIPLFYRELFLSICLLNFYNDGVGISLSVLSFDDKSLVVIACVSGVVVTMIQCYPTMTPNIFILADHCRLDSPAAQLRH